MNVATPIEKAIIRVTWGETHDARRYDTIERIVAGTNDRNHRSTYDVSRGLDYITRGLIYSDLKAHLS